MNVDTAVVLAGGPGIRLRPLTSNMPKAMVQVGGKPLLQWVVEWLRNNNILHIIVGVAYMKEKIIEYFGDGRKFGVKIEYSHHSVEGGTCEGFRLAISTHISENVFFALNGDQITNLRLDELASFHKRYAPIVTIATTTPRCPFGHIHTGDEFEVLGFLEKPMCPVAVCNSGIYVFDRDVLKYIPKKGDMETTTFPALARLGGLKAFPFRGFFVTVNTWKDLEEAERELGRTQM